MKPVGRCRYVYFFVIFFAILTIAIWFDLNAYSASLMIEDVTEQRDINHSDTQMIYQKLMKSDSKISPYAIYSLPSTQGTTSLSLSSEWKRLESTSVRAKAITSLMWNQVRKKLKEGIRKYFEQENNIPFIPTTLAKLPHNRNETLKTVANTEEESEGNKIVPKFKFGSDYIKPALRIEKPFHIDFSTNVSYHTKDQVLEASLSRKLSPDLELSLKQASYFQNEQHHDWLFGIQYEF